MDCRNGSLVEGEAQQLKGNVEGVHPRDLSLWPHVGKLSIEINRKLKILIKVSHLLSLISKSNSMF
jgi:hypothetical protein